MAATHDFTPMSVHAHMSLLGWASLALFGLVYHACPQLAERRMAKLHLALCAPAALLLPAGIAVAILTEVPGLAIGGALLSLARLHHLPGSDARHGVWPAGGGPAGRIAGPLPQAGGGSAADGLARRAPAGTMASMATGAKE
jgi:hypothetical protein